MSLNLAALDIAPGLNKDDTSFKLRQGGYRAINNMRPSDGAMEVIGGWEALSTTSMTGKVRGYHGWLDNDGLANIAFGTHSKLYVFRDGQIYDITPSSGFTAGKEDGTVGLGWGTGTWSSGTWGTASSGDYYPLTWTFGNYGETLIACARGQGIYQWSNNTAAVAAAVTNAPTENTAIVVTDRVIMAIGTKEESSGNFNPRCIRWCDFEDITDWTTAADNLVGERILEGNGALITGKVVGENIMIWTDRECIDAQFVGDPTLVFRFDAVGRDDGLIGPNAVAVLGQQAFWVGQDFKFRTRSLGGEPQVIPSPVDQDFEDAQIYAQREKIFAGTVSQYGEVWWFYPHADDRVVGTAGENTRYVAFSTQAGKWFEGTLARTCFGDSGVALYPIIGVDASSQAFIHERNTSANGDALAWSGESGDIYVDNSGKLIQLRSCRPDITDQTGVVYLEITTKPTPRGTETVHGPYTIRNTTEKVDFRATGAIVRLKFYGTDNKARARIGRPVFDVTSRGRR